jgi:hypothetical protein
VTKHNIPVLFGGAGVLAYLTFGPDIQTVVITNLDTESKFVQAVSWTTDTYKTRYKEAYNGQRCIIGSIPLFCGYSPLRTVAALPRRSDHGEWLVHAKRETRPEGEVGEEYLQIYDRDVLRWGELGGCEGS